MFVQETDPIVDMGIGKKITPKDKMIFIKKQLSTDKNWAVKALLKIFEFQTKEEQEAERTCINNNIGFTGVDGEILSSFAKQYMKRNFLSPKQMVILYKRMPKYWMQVVKISNETHLERLIRQTWLTSNS